ncbi:uncharacterized protein LOC130674444 [Microplitis mediator]|uniref:uncharacterized protein LOC130674444 n=1 Tax=Microplitis mediator TaxID=375433 RepID=UPI0025535852|nr:uncharacterized protein LOC130674444 [Microplitis mediator]
MEQTHRVSTVIQICEGCERCTTKGESISEKKRKKRIHPDMDSPARTSTSFQEKHQIGHHLDCECPLIKLMNFDPVKSVVLDSMHLLYLGVTKFLLESWIHRTSCARFKLRQVSTFGSILKSIKLDIPSEFQRKQYLVSRWKATQFRFFLLYAGGIVMKKLLPSNCYKHSLLLVVACRILHNRELMIDYNEYAKELLRQFFYLLPSLYGKKTQVLSMHNLIHVSDDVINLNLPLSDISAFWGENFIGKFNALVKPSRKPLTQIVNRLSELNSSKKIRLKINNHIDRCIIEKDSLFIYNNQEYDNVSSIYINNTIIKPTKPDNCIQLINGTIIIVRKILIKHESDRKVIKENDIYIIGSILLDTYEVFDFPTSSTDIGIVAGNKFSETIEVISIKSVKFKCELLCIDRVNYAVTLLHD